MIKDWVRDLVILVIFVSVIEMLLPGGALKKYVKVVLGFFILLTVLNPILHLLKADFQIGYPFNNLPGHSQEQQSLEAKGEVMKRTNADLANSAYQSQLAQQIRGIIITQEEVEDAWVRVKTSDGGEINQVVIGLTPAKSKPTAKTGGTSGQSQTNVGPGEQSDNMQVDIEPVEQVPKVEVAVGPERQTSTAKGKTDSPELQRIRDKVVKLITGLYNIKAEAISFK